MFRITNDPSSRSLAQCLAKNYKNYKNEIILAILAKHCTRLPDDGSSVIRNMF